MKIAIKSISILLIILFSSFITCRKVNKIKKMKNRDDFLKEVMGHFEEYIRNDAKTLPFIDIINKLQETVEKDVNNKNIDRTIETFKLIYVLLVEYYKLNTNLPICIKIATLDEILESDKIDQNFKNKLNKISPDKLQVKLQSLSETLETNKNIKQNDIEENLKNFEKNLENLSQNNNKASYLLNIINGNKEKIEQSELENYFGKCIIFMNENTSFMVKFWAEKFVKVIKTGSSWFSSIMTFSKNIISSTEKKEDNSKSQLNILIKKEEGQGQNLNTCLAQPVKNKKMRLKSKRGFIKDFFKSIIFLPVYPIVLIGIVIRFLYETFEK